MTLIAIDPGTHESAYCVVDDNHRPVEFAKLPNGHLLGMLGDTLYGRTFIEQIGHYGTGMPAGREVFDTCVWIGRYLQRLEDATLTPTLVERRYVKLHLCGSAKAKDPNVTQALVDRFAPGEPNHGKGVKANPGFFYGFKADIWQAFALAVYALDTHNTEQAALL